LENPSYYSILIAPVRYAENLTEFQKILYSEITALSNKNGYCTASNNYFAELYKKDKLTVSQAFNDMAKKGYIYIEIEASYKRKLWLCEVMPGIYKNTQGGYRKIYRGDIEKSIHNIINLNTKTNIIHPLQDFVLKELPNVSKMKKQLTYEECEKILSKFDKHKIKAVLESMENYRELNKKYTSVNLTLQNWLRRDGNANTANKQGSSRGSSERGKINKSEIEQELANAYGREETTELFEG